ncbi:unnamed protein product, partial [Pleuronectes platessa]
MAQTRRLTHSTHRQCDFILCLGCQLWGLPYLDEKQSDLLGFSTGASPLLLTGPSNPVLSSESLALEFSLLRLDDVADQRVNIVGFSVFNQTHPFFQDFVLSLNRSWQENCDHAPFAGTPLSSALLFDAVYAVVAAVQELNRSQNVGATQLSCKSSKIWEHGTSLMNYLRMVELEGLTGHIEFNSKGQRSNYSLRIMQNSKDGLRQPGRPMMMVYEAGMAVPALWPSHHWHLSPTTIHRVGQVDGERQRGRKRERGERKRVMREEDKRMTGKPSGVPADTGAERNKGLLNFGRENILLQSQESPPAVPCRSARFIPLRSTSSTSLKKKDDVHPSKQHEQIRCLSGPAAEDRLRDHVIHWPDAHAHREGGT